MSTFLYFAYGSNMLTQRLTARCPGAVPVGVGLAEHHSVTFCLQSPDGSAKAGLRPQEGRTAWGVVFEVPLAEQPILDRFEGAPHVYRRETITLQQYNGGGEIEALTYLPQPEHMTDTHKPYDWYRALCLGGARQHGLPEPAVSALVEAEHLSAPYPGECAHQGGRIAFEALLDAGFATADGVLLL